MKDDQWKERTAGQRAEGRPVIERSEIARHVGPRLAGRRIECQLTQKEVAKRVGCSRQSLGEMERGNVLPAWETLYAIARVFRCEVWDLLPKRSQVE